MANNKSAEKRIKIAERNRVINRGYRTKMKSSIKMLEDLLKNNEKEKAIIAFALVQKAIDKAADNGAIHKNKADRTKSRLNIKLVRT